MSAPQDDILLPCRKKSNVPLCHWFLSHGAYERHWSALLNSQPRLEIYIHSNTEQLWIELTDIKIWNLKTKVCKGVPTVQP